MQLYPMAVGIVFFVHGLLLLWIAAINAPVYDEIAHLPAGLSHWKFYNFDLYRVNPPLMRMIAVLPLLALDPKTDFSPFTNDPYSRPEFGIGRRFLEVNGYESFWYFTVCRWAQIPISLLGGWICFRWSKEMFGKSSGFAALILWCFCPNILAWGSTVTPDLGAAVFGVAAAYAFWCWLRLATWGATLRAAVALALAELSKSTWILLFGLWPVIWLSWRYSAHQTSAPKPRGLQLACILALALYLINACYGFEETLQRLDSFNFISRTLGGTDAHNRPGNRFRGMWLGSILVPLPANYLKGIDVQKYDFEKGKWSYLHGEHKHGGWYHYYLYALAVKTPLGTLFLILLATFLPFAQRGYSLRFLDASVLLLPALAVIILVSSQTGFNKYLRYVLPVLPFAFIFASRSAMAFEFRRPFTKALCGIGLLLSVIESLTIFPHSMSYFNLAVGGPLCGPKHLIDANIDWGQDLLELKRFIERHPEMPPIKLVYFGVVDPKLANFNFESILQLSDTSSSQLEPGWYAISVNHIFRYRGFRSAKPDFTYFQTRAPDATAGYSIYIYNVTTDSTMPK